MPPQKIKKVKKEAAMDSRYSHILEQLWTTQWAIIPEMLDTMYQIVDTRIKDGKSSIEEIEAKFKKKEESESGSYTTEKNVRVIPIQGVIAKRMNLFSRISGGTSTEILKNEIEDAIADESIKSILLDIESPGGSVDGPFELSDFIYNARGTKPIYAFANGLMASAAYLIGSAADKIIGTQTSQIGSIGIITKHNDFSKRDEMDGVKTTIITSGKYKAVGSDNKPLSKEDEQYIQSRLDYYYTMFVDAIARNRNVSAETVLSDMADGRIFIGKQAQDAGLIDSIGTLEVGLEQCFQAGGIDMNTETIIKKGGEKKMTFDELKQDTELYNAMKAEVKAEMKVETGKVEGRVADLESKLAERDVRVSALEKENEKREAMRIEADRMSKAKGIVASKLSDSKVPERLYGKISNLIDYSQFMKDEDAEAFSAQVDAEIKDWEGLEFTPSIGGLSATTKTDVKTVNEDTEDEIRADNLFAFVKK